MPAHPSLPLDQWHTRAIEKEHLFLDQKNPKIPCCERYLSFAERFQLSDVGWRGDRVQCGNMDAAHCPRLARAHSIDPQQCDCHGHGHGAPVRTPSSLATFDRFCGRSSRTAKAPDRNASRHGNPRLRTGYPHHHRARPVVACVRVCVSAWLRDGVRLAGASHICL